MASTTSLAKPVALTAPVNRQLVPQQLVPYRLATPPDPYSKRIRDMRLVDFRSDPRDWGVPFLAAFGMSRDVIARQCNLTRGQVDYRLQKLNAGRPRHQRINSMNYRNGSSPVAQMVIENVGKRVKNLLAPVVARQITVETTAISI